MHSNITSNNPKLTHSQQLPSSVVVHVFLSLANDRSTACLSTREADAMDVAESTATTIVDADRAAADCKSFMVEVTSIPLVFSCPTDERVVIPKCE